MNADAKTTMLHNNFVVSILSDVEIAADFLSRYLPDETAAVDWSRLKCEPTAFASDQNKVSFADLTFSAPLKNSENSATFLALLEHKSNAEKRLPLQLLKYVALQANYFAENGLMEVDGRWPCPAAFVLYNGSKPWRKPPKTRDVLYSAKKCERCVPSFDYFLLDLAATDVENLRGGPLTRIFLELLKRAKDGTLAKGCEDIFVRWRTRAFVGRRTSNERSSRFYITSSASRKIQVKR